jgi:hypothetical protein
VFFEAEGPHLLLDFLGFVVVVVGEFVDWFLVFAGGTMFSYDCIFLTKSLFCIYLLFWRLFCWH